MLSVALTGGIGAGKSLVGEIFEELGAIVIDSDQISRDVIERGTDGYDEVVARFGDQILTNGEINRAALGEIVFNDADARRDLEAIIHPRVREISQSIAAKAGDGQIVINQIPLLVETRGYSKFDCVITIQSSLEIREERLRSRGMKDYEIKRRIEAQVDDEKRAEIADFVIINDGTVDELRRNVERIWDQLRMRAS